MAVLLGSNNIGVHTINLIKSPNKVITVCLLKNDKFPCMGFTVIAGSIFGHLIKRSFKKNMSS